MNKELINAGDVDIQLLELSTVAGISVDLRDYLVELNIHQDIFAPTMHGNIMVSDSRNIIHDLYISGYEFLMVKILTPSFKQGLEKTFRVYSITNRTIVRDTNTQTYILHFCSPEAFADNIISIQKFYKGSISDIVQSIYGEYLQVSGSNGLTMLDETANKIEYISPGWGPIKNITWLASQAYPSHSPSPSFLFWETPVCFYFGSLEYLLKEYKSGGFHHGEYTYSASNHWKDVEGNQDGYPLRLDMMKIHEYEVVDQTDEISKTATGYYANSLYCFDINQKKLSYAEYDHPNNWNVYTHLEREGVQPLFIPGLTTRTPDTVMKFNSNSWNLFDNSANPEDETYKVWGRRRSILQDYSTTRINITIPGRTDLIAGNVLKLKIIKTSPRSIEDAAKDFIDTVMSGYYLIASLRHKITLLNHYIIAEMVKDSLSVTDGDS